MEYKICDEKNNVKYLPMLEKIRENLRISEGFKYFCSIDGNEVIGYVEFLVQEKKYIIYDIYVIESHRYKSQGKNLIKFLINVAISNGIEEIFSYEKINFTFLKKIDFSYDSSNKRMFLENLQKKLIREKTNKRIVIYSIFQNMFLATIKILGGKFGNSQGLLSDGINSLSDVITSFGILMSMYFSGKPADAEHPYGHEKIESIISIILGIIIVITGFELGRLSIYKFLKREYLSIVPDIKLIIIAFISMVIKYYMYKNKLKIGIKNDNIALISDAKDSKSDVYSSVGVIFGILFSVYINPIFDVILSFVVSILIFKEGIASILATANIILETQDSDFIKKIEEYIYKNTEVTNVHDIIMKKSGSNIFLSMHVRLPGTMTLYEAHKISDILVKKLLKNFENLSDITIHIDYIISKLH